MFAVLFIWTMSCYITQSWVNSLFTTGPRWSCDSSSPVPDHSRSGWSTDGSERSRIRYKLGVSPLSIVTDYPPSRDFFFFFFGGLKNYPATKFRPWFLWCESALSWAKRQGVKVLQRAETKRCLLFRIYVWWHEWRKGRILPPGHPECKKK